MRLLIEARVIMGDNFPSRHEALALISSALAADSV